MPNPSVPFLPPDIIGMTTAGLSPAIGTNKALQATSGGFSTWKRGDILRVVTTGSAANPYVGASGTTFNPAAGTPTLGPALAAGQGAFNIISSSTSIVSGAVTVAATASASAPALTYFCIVTYTFTANESLGSQEFIINCPAGLVPTVSVSATGAPASTTNFALYVSLLPGYEILQQATKTTTATGAAFTIPFPLTNDVGLQQAATNASTAFFGMAIDDQNAQFFSGVGGSGQVGNQSLFGATMTQAPLTATEAMLNYVYKLQGLQLEMSLVQAWNPILAGTTAGLTLDPTTGFYVADTSQGNKVMTIGGPVIGPAAFQGGLGITGTRVSVVFISGAALV